MSNTIKAKLKNSTSDLKEAGDVYIFEGAGDSGWHWNGSYHKPSLKPSILRMSGCHWHGYLTEGEFREC